MDDSSKESNVTENAGQQNNNSITNESNQENGNSTTSKRENGSENETNVKVKNNESNCCDIDDPLITLSQGGDSKEIKQEDGNKEVSEVEMGSPEKQIVQSSAEMDHGPSNSFQKLDTAAQGANSACKEANIDFKVIYNKKKYDVSLSPDTNVGALKTHLHPIINIPPAMMKVNKVLKLRGPTRYRLGNLF